VGVVAVTIGMLPTISQWRPGTVWVLGAGVGLWLVELYRTPRDRALEAATLLGVGASGAALNALAPQSPGFVLAFFAVSGLGMRFPPRPAAVLSALIVVAVNVGIAVTSTQVATSVTTSDLGLAFVFVAAAATRAALSANARTSVLLAELEKSRAAQEASAALAERARLAREIHDILAHSLSGQVMSLEATRMLAERTGADPRVVAEIDRAHRLAKDGLGDARRAVSALRGEALPGPERLPQLVRDAQAVQQVRATLEVHGQSQALAPDAGLCLYRTAQEALTNTAKHAGRGASAHLVLSWSLDTVHLDVTDTRRPGTATSPESPEAVLPSGGYGLTGLRERAELAGGSLTTGPTVDGFRVSLTLPTKHTTDAVRTPSAGQPHRTPTAGETR
jgi:signal transduction histidine kinase